MVLRALVLLVAAILGSAASAEERILSFDVAIEVEPDGTLEVTETLRVRAEGTQIRRGIYRDFPVEYSEDDGRISLASFEVQEVMRNGAAEPYTLSRSGSDMRLRIGRGDVFLPVPSEQVYEYRYRSAGHLRNIGELDELYWDVTGDRWAFPIDSASVEIRLPDGISILQHEAYTGPYGAQGTDFEVLGNAGGIYSARTTAALAPGEGFTVAVAWPAGAVEVPPVRYGVPGIGGYGRPPMTVGGTRLAPYAAVLGTLIGVLALFVGWARVGRDPQGGAVYPRFDPPEGLSPAAMRYVSRQGFDRNCLTAAILGMAVKGAVRIVERPRESLFGRDTYHLDPQGIENRELSVGERAAYHALFPFGRSLTLKTDDDNGKRVGKAREVLRSKLWDEHYGASFRRNWIYTLGGVGAGVLASVLLIGTVERWNVLALLEWGLPALLMGALILGIGAILPEIRDLRAGARPGWNRLVRLLPFLLIGGFALFGPASVLTAMLLAMAVDLSPVLLAGAAFGVAAALFHFLMAAPTKAGRTVMDGIEGFRIYMEAAEQDRLDILHPPELTPELFERLLPYAVALGLAHQWSGKFAGILTAAAYVPDWYSGGRGFEVDRFDRSFSSAVSSAGPPASRGSGGSGGGGFSGGGGGGGGGGGW